MRAWLSTSLHRFYPRSIAEPAVPLTLDAARGERLSFQASLRIEAGDAIIRATADAPDGLAARVRRVGYVTLAHLATRTEPEDIEGFEHLPGLVPDPLFSDAEGHVGPFETITFWVSISVAPDAPPGDHTVTVRLVVDGGPTFTLPATVRVHPIALPQRRDFPVTHWFYADALMDWYGTRLTDDRFWRILDPYLRNLVEHGSDTLYVPTLTPSLDGIKRPTQLLGIRRDGNGYAFDWSLVRRWLAAAQAAGLHRLEWAHLFTQWGAQNAVRVYLGHGEEGDLLWSPETGATSDVYRAFLTQYLGELRTLLAEEDLLDRSFFHLSDEPHGADQLASYGAARAMLRDIAPWLPVMDALTEIDFARQGLTDIPVPSITTAPDFVREGIPAWAYFCCWPRGRYLNRLLDTPLTKIRMSGWLLYRLKARGFLHWGYNYWYRRATTTLIDPFTVNDAHAWPNWAGGDPFVVYPGPDGPIDSLRWEVFAESLQDYALLQGADIDPDDPRLADIQDYAEFPRDAGWVLARRRELLDADRP